MKKKDAEQQKAASELLKKLQASFLGSASKKSRDTSDSSDDADDAAFQDQISGMLRRLSQAEEAESGKKKKKAAKQKQAEPVKGIEEIAEEPAPEPVEEVAKEPAPEPAEEVAEEPAPEPAEEVAEEPAPEPKKPTLKAKKAEKKLKKRPVPKPASKEPIPEEPIPEEAFIQAVPVTSEPKEAQRDLPVAEELPTEPKETVKVSPKLEPQEIPAPQKAPEEKPVPQKEAPGVSLPRSAPNAFLKRESEPEQEPIVIQPRVERKQMKNEPIVIKPRQPEPPEAPVKEEPEASAQPIRIGKKTAVRIQEPVRQAPPDYQNTRPAPAAQPTPDAGSAEAAKSASSSRGISLPRQHEETRADAFLKSAPESAPAPKSAKKQSRGSAPSVMVFPEDDRYDEALDEDLAAEARTEEIPVEGPELNPSAEKKTTIFERRRIRKQQEAEEAMTAIGIAQKKSGLNADDIDMIFELGYENELGRLVGYDLLKKIKYEHTRKVRRADGGHFRTAFGYRGTDYTGNEPKESILAAYVHDRKSLMVRLILTVLITLVLIPLELPALFGNLFTPYTESMPFLFPLAGTLLLFAAAWLSFRQIRAGARALFHFTPTPYSLNALLVPLVLIYGILRIVLNDAALTPVNLAASFSLLVTALCDAFRISDEMRTFGLVSCEEVKTVLEATEPKKKKLRHGEKIVKIINDEIDDNLYRVRRTEDAVGFFRRSNDLKSTERPFTVLLTLTLSVSALAGIVIAVLTESALTAIGCAAAALALSSPVCAVYFHFFPLPFANRRLLRRDCAIVGEESVAEYSQPKTVIFNDTEMVAARKCSQVSVRDGDDFKNDMQLASILFRKISASLGKVVLKSASAKDADAPVTFIRIAESGIEAMVDNQHHMLAGNAAFLAKSGVRVPKESSDRSLRRGGNVSLLYVAIDGILKLSYEIEYTVEPSFEKTVSLLAHTDTVAAIQTYDPNLNSAFLHGIRPEDSYYVRVMKPGRYEPDTVLEVTDTGILSLGGVSDLVYPLRAATRIRRLHTVGYRLQFASILLGAVTACVLSLRASSLLPFIPALFPPLYHVAWLIVSRVLVGISLRKGNLFDK